MKKEVCSFLWNKYVETAKITGKRTKEEIGKEPKKETGKEDNDLNDQAGYSLYRAFYKKNSKYYWLESDLISAFFRENDYTIDFLNEEELSNKLGKEAEDVISGIPESNLNAEQKLAIRNALKQRITLVQGPPGTGKTEMILYFLAVIRKLDMLEKKRNPKAKPHSVAIVSCNNEALKNIKDKLDAYNKTDDPKNIFNSVSKHFAVLGNMKNRKKWSEIDDSYVYIEEKCTFRDDMLEEYPFFTSTIHSMSNCFEYGNDKRRNGYTNEIIKFDYVIIDECSQVSLSLGLVAMAQAEHLVLVGDDMQLQAIIAKEAIDSLNGIFKDLRGQSEQEKTEIRERLEEENKSFLKACKSIFPKAPDIMLVKHYRCHPSMAQFCNKYVYNGKLEVMTKGDGLRIDITWYDGEFMENYYHDGRTLTEKCKKNYLEKGVLKKPGDKEPSQRCNTRQIRIFLEEKLPSLKKIIQDAKDAKNPIPSICVMAPFCIQLEVLKDELDKDEDLKKLLKDEGNIEIEKDPNSEDEKEKKENENDLQSLSIHKSQGRSYDYVYLMTVEDDFTAERAPWGQSMRIINVAASRAKKEFHVITSRIWIPRYIQRSLPVFKDAYPPVAPMPTSISTIKTFADNSEEEKFYDYRSTDAASREKFFIGRLCQWVYGWYKQGTEDFGKFGFHKANEHSIFDRFFGNEKINKRLILKEALARELKLDIVSASLNDTDSIALDLIPISEKAARKEELERKAAAASGEEKTKPDFPEFKTYLNQADFLFVCENNNIKAIVHVLDESYRNGCETKYDFQTKLEKYISELPAGEIYVQIPTDGSLGNEIEAVREACRVYDESGLRINYKPTPLKQVLNGITKDCVDWADEYTKVLDKNKIKMLDFDYINPEDVNYTEEAQKFYFCRYGTAYAFEYALMYDLVFRNVKSSECNILSLGCGSCVDAFSAAYSRDFCGRNDIKLTYHGVDRVKWDLNLLEPVRHYFEKAVIPQEGDKGDIVDYFKHIEALDSNVIFFPKILNELNNDKNDTKKKLIEAAEGKLDPNKDEYFFCFSHSKSNCIDANKSTGEIGSAKTAENIKFDVSFVDKFIKSLNSNGYFDVNANITKEEHYKDHEEKWRSSNKAKLTSSYPLRELGSPYFCFKSEENGKKTDCTVNFSELNPDFRDDDADDRMGRIIDKINKDPNVERSFRLRIKYVNPIAYFQIIHLTRKKKED